MPVLTTVGTFVLPLIVTATDATVAPPAPPSSETPAASTPAPLDFRLDLAAMQDDPAPAADSWRVRFTPMAWMLGVTGDIGVGDRVADVDADFGDILDASDSILAFSGRLEVGKGRWGAFVDVFWADLGVDDASGPDGLADVDVSFEETFLEFGLSYRLGSWAPSGAAAGHPHDITLDLLVGGRYTNLDLELDTRDFGTFSRRKSWVDPLVGAAFHLPLAERWHLEVRGDVGGFGVESDFAWSATALFGWSFSMFDHPAALVFGYRGLGQDFEDGSGQRKFTWDVISHGPLLGLTINF